MWLSNSGFMEMCKSYTMPSTYVKLTIQWFSVFPELYPITRVNFRTLKLPQEETLSL